MRQTRSGRRDEIHGRGNAQATEEWVWERSRRGKDTLTTVRTRTMAALMRNSGASNLLYAMQEGVHFVCAQRTGTSTQTRPDPNLGRPRSYLPTWEPRYGYLLHYVGRSPLSPGGLLLCVGSVRTSPLCLTREGTLSAVLGTLGTWFGIFLSL